MDLFVIALLVLIILAFLRAVFRGVQERPAYQPHSDADDTGFITQEPFIL